MGNETDPRMVSMFDATSAQEVSRSIGQLCSTFSLTNIKIPRFDSFKDVHDFVAEFEELTITMSDEQKLIVVSKAFPIGCHRTWFESNVSPLIKENKFWVDVKRTLIDRFSIEKSEDRDFVKLHSLKFDEESDKSLLSFVDDVLYYYRKAYGPDHDIQAIRHIKANLPTRVTSSLSNYSEYREARTIEDLKKAAKLYDLSKGSIQHARISREATHELTQAIKEMITKLSSESKQTREAVASLAAFQARDKSTNSVQEPSRNASPSREYYTKGRPLSPGLHQQQIPRYPEPYKRSVSPGYSNNDYGWPKSPRRYGYNSPSGNIPRLSYQNQNTYRPQAYQNYERPSSPQMPLQSPPYQEALKQKSEVQENAFNSNMYFARFGKPPTPCQQCNAWHWRNHCPFMMNHLN